MWRQRVTPAAPDRWGLRPSGILTLPSFEVLGQSAGQPGQWGLLHEVQLPLPESQPRCVVSWLLRAPDVIASQDTGGTGFPGARVVARPAGRGGLVALERTVDRRKRPGGPDRLHGAQAAGPGTLTPGPASPSPAWPLPALVQRPGGHGSTPAPAHCRPESAYSTRVGRHWPAGVRAA